MRMFTVPAICVAATMLIVPLLAFGQSTTAPANDEKSRFRAYLDADWKQWMQEYPDTATNLGYPGQNRRWTDDSAAGIESRKKHLQESLATLRAIRREALDAEEQLNYDLYLDLLQTAEEGLQFGDDPAPFRDVAPRNLWMPVNQMENVATIAASALANMPNQSVADYEDILARLDALPKSVEENAGLLREGLKRGYTPPRVIMAGVPEQIAALIPADPLKSALLQPFQKFPPGFPEADRVRLTERAKQVYSAKLVPAFQALRDYLARTYIPACRESIAATALPNGAAAYAFHVRWQTTTALTPQQIHEIGLSEVKRIRAEMDNVIASAGFMGSFHDFTEFLRSDPRFYYRNAEDLVNGYRIIAKKIDPELTHQFGKLPRLTYGVCPIPDFKAPAQTTAYYQPGAPRVGRAGCYFVNTYKLNSRPKWEMEALSLHESVPGHHLQIALAQELEGAPEFRKATGYSAFVEGWALYSESLGEDLGFYKDPYSKFGQLTYEMWRAVRLVVDTGMHSMGWPRDRAIQFFRDNTGKTDQDITVEVDRYIAWPGQALAYKLGQMKIRELRTEAGKKLGARFDVRGFHDAVLAQGAVPLNILEANLQHWIAAQAAH